MVTIVLLVSRENYLRRVLSNLELLDCDPETVSFLCIVDGTDQLFIKVRNQTQDLKFKNVLCVKSTTAGVPFNLDIRDRRRRIAAAHNQARALITHDTGYVFSIEDDTIIPTNALRKLIYTAVRHRAFASICGVELGRWGLPYVGAWQANDIYELAELNSIPSKVTEGGIENIDACGLYCTLIRADLYKQHEFTSKNGLGPDINLAIENRQLGFENFIDWSIHCIHLYKYHDEELELKATDESQQITLFKMTDKKWGARS